MDSAATDLLVQSLWLEVCPGSSSPDELVETFFWTSGVAIGQPIVLNVRGVVFPVIGSGKAPLFDVRKQINEHV